MKIQWLVADVTLSGLILAKLFWLIPAVFAVGESLRDAGTPS